MLKRTLVQSHQRSTRQQDTHGLDRAFDCRRPVCHRHDRQRAQSFCPRSWPKATRRSTPSSGTIRTIETFDEDLVRSVRRMAGVQDADGRTHLTVRFQVKRSGMAKRRTLLAGAICSCSPCRITTHMRVNKIRPQSGAWPPPPHELLIERSALELIGAQVGDWL